MVQFFCAAMQQLLYRTKKEIVSKQHIVTTFHRSGWWFEILQCYLAGTWNRRNNSKNNGSMSFSSFVAFGRWNVVFAPVFFIW